MAIPTDYIFTAGSCQKKDLYQLIIDKLTAAGWTNVSSLATSDYVVLTSPGNTEDKNLILNIRDIPAAGTAANTVKTSAYCQMSYRLQPSYTPGTAGAAGTFGRPALAWTDLYIVPVAASGQLAPDTIVNYKVYADANGIILTVEYPPATGYGPILIHMRQPDTVYMPENGNQGMLVAVTNGGTTAASAMICDSPVGMGAVTAPYAVATAALLPMKNPNNAGKYFDSPVYYQTAAEGMRGKLDGIQCMPNLASLTGDNITIDGDTYYVLVCHTQGVTSFPSQVLLVRIA